MLVVFIVVVVFIIGLVMFLKKLPEIKKAARDGWNEGKPKSKP